MDERVMPEARLEPTVRKATGEDVPALAAVLGRAFSGDPFVDWCVCQRARLRRGRDEYFAVALRRFALPFGEVYRTEGCTGAALWIPPGAWDARLRGGLPFLRDVARLAGVSRAVRVLRGMAALGSLHPHARHFYLLFLGVDPACQGQGIGTALMRPVLERCDRERIGAYLETANPRTLSLYLRHGFAECGRWTIPCGPTLWRMWREPRAG